MGVRTVADQANQWKLVWVYEDQHTRDRGMGHPHSRGNHARGTQKSPTPSDGGWGWGKHHGGL